jgi:hypothetical protein
MPPVGFLRLYRFGGRRYCLNITTFHDLVVKNIHPEMNDYQTFELEWRWNKRFDFRPSSMPNGLRPLHFDHHLDLGAEAPLLRCEGALCQ